MKKLILLSLAVLFVMVGVSYATVEIASPDNAVIVGPYMGPVGKTPVTEVIKVYVTSHGTLEAETAGYYIQPDATAAADQGVDVGDVMEWDLTRADGYCVTICNADTYSSGIAASPFAGVMVTPCSRDTATLTTPSGTGYNVGYMAIRGFVYAKIDTSNSTTGEALIPNGGTLEGSLGTVPTIAKISGSQDIGILLTDTASDGLMKVWLR